jgi:hypothetical protein
MRGYIFAGPEADADAYFLEMSNEHFTYIFIQSLMIRVQPAMPSSF